MAKEHIYAKLDDVNELSNKQNKESIVIGNFSNGATLAICDVLYNENDNFADTFNTACELSTTLGISRIKLLDGIYELDTMINLNKNIEIIGIGAIAPTLKIRYSDSNPSFDSFFNSLNDDATYKFENINFDDANISIINDNADSRIIMKNVTSNAENILIKSLIVYMKRCTFKNIELSHAENSQIISSNIDKLIFGNNCKTNIVTNNVIGILEDNGNNNFTKNNIINGNLPQYGDVSYATYKTPGIITAGSGFILETGKLNIREATDTEIKHKCISDSVLTPNYLDYAVRYSTHQNMSDNYNANSLYTSDIFLDDKGYLPVSYNAVKSYIDELKREINELKESINLLK